MPRRIDQEVRIYGGEGCPIRLKDCALFYDRGSDTYSMQLSLENDSGKELAGLVVHVVGYDGRGREAGSQKITYHFQKSAGGQYLISADKGLLLPIGEVDRLTARIGRAWALGRRGERVDLLGDWTSIRDFE